MSTLIAVVTLLVTLVAGYLLLGLVLAIGLRLLGKPDLAPASFQFSPKARLTPRPLEGVVPLVVGFGICVACTLDEKGLPIWVVGMCGGFTGRILLLGVQLLGAKLGISTSKERGE